MPRDGRSYLMQCSLYTSSSQRGAGVVLLKVSFFSLRPYGIDRKRAEDGDVIFLRYDPKARCTGTLT